VPGRPIPEPLDGLVIGGGDDVDPVRYGEARRITSRIDPERDLVEWQMLETAAREDLPVLGICRGAQVLNVFHGGTLWQDLRDFDRRRPPRATLLATRRVSLEAGTRLHRVLETDAILVNSLHRQAVRRVAPGFRVAARDSRGLIQAVESTGERYRVGVQWHPELLPRRPEHRRLFRALVEDADRRAAGERT
jgi:putative glutamine amidotransferase